MRHRISKSWSAGLASTLLLGVLAGCDGQDAATGGKGEDEAAVAGQPEARALDVSQLALADVAANPWRSPPEIRSVKGRLQAKLRVGLNEFENPYGSGPRLRLRSYEHSFETNPVVVGPTLRFKAGDQLHVTLENALPSSDGDPPVEDRTNFHTHGLHISPGCHPSLQPGPPCQVASDNVLLDIWPGTTQQFRFDIPPAGTRDQWKHYPGTFWYHAHRHGSTSVQVASGMSGALILEDEDEMRQLNLTRAQGRLFILQQLAFDADGEVKRVSDLRDNWEGKSTTINGVVKPFFTMRPGEVERWRLVGSGIFETINFGIERKNHGSPPPPDLYLIAIDGITLKQRRIVSRYELGPGYRADLVVKAPDRPGDYVLVKDKATLALGLGESTDTPSILAELRVTGAHCSKGGCRGVELPPENLPHPMSDVTEFTGHRQIEFDLVGSPPTKFLINGKEYSKDRVDQTMMLNSSEEWFLISKRGNHPFHIHVNAFQLVNEDGTLGDWHDTIIAPASGVRMRTRYERFTGKFVLHCHILDHEDRGMMQLVEIKN